MRRLAQPLLRKSYTQPKFYTRRVNTFFKPIKQNWGQWMMLGSAIIVGGFAYSYLSGEAQEEKDKKKKHIVILGTGWASQGLVDELKKKDYYVTIVSPRNYFLFTPLLPGVTTGTIDDRSLIQSLRSYVLKYNKDSRFEYFEATCTSIDPTTNTIFCEDLSELIGKETKFTLNYDYLVVAVGAYNNTFGVPGVTENAHYLKSLEDANKIRSRIIDCFETANLKGQPKEERKKLLSFVIVGGGPTGCEFAGELNDLIQEDLKHYYPHLMDDVSINLIQSQDHIMNTFDKKISEYVEKKFLRDNINVMTSARVKEVKQGAVTVWDKTKNGYEELPFGLCVWSTGLQQNPLVQKLTESLKEKGQVNNKALLVDYHLKVLGTDNIFALGDCSTIHTPKLLSKLEDLFKQADKDANGTLSYDEFTQFLRNIATDHPQLDVFTHKVKKYFEDYDTNKDNQLNLEEFKQLITYADNNVKLLPQTAQVAAQEGSYLGKNFEQLIEGKPVPPFKYKHSGFIAYVGGDSAVGELPGLPSFWGYFAFFLWKGVYLSKQRSWNNFILVNWDWIKFKIFGRDISRF